MHKYKNGSGGFTVSRSVLFLALLLPVNAMADLLDAVISTGANETRVIDLTNNISGISNPMITVATAPQNGVAAAVNCPRTGEPLCIEYTPNQDFSGIDTFSFSVINDSQQTETAQISVNVGNVIAVNSGKTADNSVRDTLESICGVDQASEVDVLCQGFNSIGATTGSLPPDLRELLDALAPQDIAAQTTTGSVMANQQLENIGKHLSALRRGQSSVALGGFNFRYKKTNLNGDFFVKYLTDENQNNIAQNTFGINWGWFLNGNLISGDQNESAYENGFEFKTDGISTGVDYRLGRYGIVGAAFGYANTNLDLDLHQGGLDANGMSAVLYSSWYTSNKSYLDIIVSANRNTFDSSRRIVFGTTDTFAYSNNLSYSLASSIAMGYETLNFGGLVATTDIKAEFIKAWIDGYAETGDSAFNVTVNSRQEKQLSASIGSTITYAISTSVGVFIPQFDMFVVHQFENKSSVINGYFSADPNKTEFNFDSNVPDSNFIRYNAGVSAVLAGGHSVFVQYGSNYYRNDYNNWHVSLGYRTEF